MALEREEILVAAEDVLRRYGPGKASVVDVSRALGVSHGSVYRHFDSKAALRDAVVERWLARGTGELTAIAFADDPAATARAVFDATVRFHKPSHAAEWSDPESRRRSTAWSRSCSPASVHVARLPGQHDARRLAAEPHARFDRHHLAPRGPAQQLVGGREAGQLLERLDRGEDEQQGAGAVRGERAPPACARRDRPPRCRRRAARRPAGSGARKKCVS